MKRISILLIMVAAAVLAACKPEKEIDVQSVAIEGGDVSLAVGQTKTFTATVLPANAKDRTVEWLSSDERIVRIASNGKAKALAVGSAEIRAEAGGESSTVTVTVVLENPPADAPLTLAAEKITAVSVLLKGQTRPGSGTAGLAGIQYCKSAGMTSANSVIAEAAGTDADNTFLVAVSGLDPGTTYFYRSIYREDGHGLCGEIKEFKTKELSSMLETLAASDIEAKSAVLHAKLDLTDVVYEKLSYGFVWGKTGEDLKGEPAASDLADKAFSDTLSKLSGNTAYDCKAFVTLDGATYFAAARSFTTEKLPVFQEPVDLGLSVKWASCNLGAETPEGYGDYYAWGEVETYYESLDPITWKEWKQYGDWLSYRWYKEENDNSWITKYVDDADYGTVDNKFVLDPEDDAAAVLLGDGWRMPTHEEWNELISSCTWTWTNVNEVEGYKVEGNGNSIFLPASGCMDFKIRFREDEGYYWSSSLFETEIAFAVNFWNDEDPPGTDFAADRTTGLTIRPVKP